MAPGCCCRFHTSFFARDVKQLGFQLPAPGEYGVGMLFLPLDEARRKAAEAIVERVVNEEGLKLLGWRDVPTVPGACGDIARRAMPAIRQVFIGRGAAIRDSDALERKLYVIRKRASNEALASLGLRDPELFYFCSLSSITIVYKGQLISHQMPEFFPDLLEPEFSTALAMVHQRFSTNTFPSWDRAHPYRFIRTTAKSIRCAATSTGCTRAKSFFVAAFRRRHSQAPSDYRADRQRLRDVR